MDRQDYTVDEREGSLSPLWPVLTVTFPPLLLIYFFLSFPTTRLFSRDISFSSGVASLSFPFLAVTSFFNYKTVEEWLAKARLLHHGFLRSNQQYPQHLPVRNDCNPGSDSSVCRNLLSDLPHLAEVAPEMVCSKNLPWNVARAVSNSPPNVLSWEEEEEVLTSCRERSPPLPSGWFNWVGPFWKIPDTYALQHQSLDAYLFLRFLRMTIVIMFVGACITWPILYVLPTPNSSMYGHIPCVYADL